MRHSDKKASSSRPQILNPNKSKASDNSVQSFAETLLNIAAPNLLEVARRLPRMVEVSAQVHTRTLLEATV